MMRRFSNLKTEIPTPAKRLEFMWFLGTNQVPNLWPKKFGSNTDEVNSAVETLSNEQVVVFYDEQKEQETNDPFHGNLSEVWVFSSHWKGYSRRYFKPNLQNVIIDVKNHSENSKLYPKIDREQVFFVCGHGNRDHRCGNKGPKIIQTLEKQNIRYRLCSHTGGHRFAGNVISLPRAEWFALVDETNVGEILNDNHQTVYCRGCSW